MKHLVIGGYHDGRKYGFAGKHITLEEDFNSSDTSGEIKQHHYERQEFGCHDNSTTQERLYFWVPLGQSGYMAMLLLIDGYKQGENDFVSASSEFIAEKFLPKGKGKRTFKRES